jgi:alpha-glucosidase (family GH31 glycosyl hydrolase)
VHFTGDTSSTWASLQFQVGYTGGQAATTGLSPVSHDIGGFNAERAPLPEDLYVRWVQLGAFQPILRLHGNHSPRLPWEYGDDARDASIEFLNLRENLVPFTYTLAHQAAETGVPVVRPAYLENPDRPEAFGAAGGQYFYGSDVLVAPITSPGRTASTQVWFPPGVWTDFFTGRTYTGPSTQQVSADWATMPVFLRAGGIVPQRGHDVANDRQHPLDDVRVTVAGGGNGTFTLYEDDGAGRDAAAATTRIAYTEQGTRRTVRIEPAQGAFAGRPDAKTWTITVRNATPPTHVELDGAPLARSQWTWDAATRSVTVAAGARSVGAATTITIR